MGESSNFEDDNSLPLENMEYSDSPRVTLGNPGKQTSGKPNTNTRSVDDFHTNNINSKNTIFKNYTFKNFNSISSIAKYSKAKAMDYVLKFNLIKDLKQNSIAFLGQVGSGKSHLCMAITNSLLENDIQVFYMPYREAITELKQNILDETRYLRIIQKYKYASVLYIDDLFKGKITESDINIMFEIINFRYINNKQLIVSSEYRTDKLIDFDEAIGSRIIEMCRGYLVLVDGKENNYRLRGIV